MSLLIAVCDKERIFVESLAENLNQKFKDQMEVMAFDNAASLRSFLEKKDVDLCLIAEDMCSYEIEQDLIMRAENLAYFSADKLEGTIYKYQSVDAICRQIILLCEKMELPLKAKRTPFGESKCDFIGFYSPSPFSGQSIVAFSFAKIMAKNKKVLYINPGGFTGLSQFFDCPFHQDMLDLLFYLKEGSSRFDLKLKGTVQAFDEVDYIPPTMSYIDLEQIDAVTWEKLLIKIMQESDYEMIVFDFPVAMHGIFHIMELCACIFVCKQTAAISQTQFEEFHQFLTYAKKEEIWQKVKLYSKPGKEIMPQKAVQITYSKILSFVLELKKEYDKGRI